MLDEMLDRYGEPPKSVQLLLDVALLRSAAAALGISDITQKGSEITLTFTSRADVQAIAAVCGLAKYRQRLRLSAGEKARLICFLKPGQDALSATRELVEELQLQQKEYSGTVPGEEDINL